MTESNPTIRICPVCQGQKLFVEDVPIMVNGKMTIQHRGSIVDCKWCSNGTMDEDQFHQWKLKTRNGLLTKKPTDDPGDD